MLHLWDHTLVDLKSIGIQTLYTNLTSGSIHHIETRVLQCVLLKVALLLGVKIIAGAAFKGMPERDGARSIEFELDPTRVSLEDSQLLESTAFDAVFGADGERSRVADAAGFEKKVFRAGLSIGIVANFVNHGTAYERTREEFAISRHFYQRQFAGTFVRLAAVSQCSTLTHS